MFMYLIEKTMDVQMQQTISSDAHPTTSITKPKPKPSKKKPQSTSTFLSKHKHRSKSTAKTKTNIKVPLRSKRKSNKVNKFNHVGLIFAPSPDPNETLASKAFLAFSSSPNFSRITPYRNQVSGELNLNTTLSLQIDRARHNVS